MTFAQAKSSTPSIFLPAGNHWFRMPEKDTRDLDSMRHQMIGEIEDLLSETNRCPVSGPSLISDLKAEVMQLRHRKLLETYEHLAKQTN